MAEVAVLGALLSPLAKLFFDKMASGELMDFFGGRKSTAKLLKQLEIQLLSVSAVLEDAGEKQVTHPDVKKWFNELKDAVYDAEDLLDKIATEALGRKLDAEFQGTAITKVRNRISTSVNHFVKGIDSEIKELLETLEFLAKQKDIIGLRAGVGEKLPKSFPTTSPVEESSVFGRDNDKKVIINLLLSDCGRGNEMSVIAIVGMGGIGKTTVAQLVYNDSRVRSHFNLQAWFCVSEEFDESTIKKSIIEAVTELPCDIRDPDQIQVTLQEKLKDKCFLLVLDDVWTENPVHQKFLNEILRYGVRGSKIIITTRNESVVAAMHVIAIHSLDKLSEESCWSLLRKHAFHDSSITKHPELEELGQNIVKKCQCLPLAIKAIGDLLWSERNVEKWDKILKSELWDFPIDKTDILPALRLSYLYLPSHLKRCFSYCSIFPKGYGFQKEQLVLMWMGEGFLHQSKIETMEEIGDRYFLALVSRSLFQQSGDDKLHFRMHDLVHDLAKSVAGQFSFTLEGHSSHELVQRTRHLSFFCASLDKFEKIDESFYQPKKLRTFVALDSSSWASKVLRENVIHKLLPMLRCLRVLSLSNNRDITTLPSSIDEIKHLRYLDFSFTRLKRLPNSICKLHNLQTLKLLGCGYLLALPTDLSRLVLLRHLDIAGTGIKEMPTKLGSLKFLYTLTAFVIGKGIGSSIRELQNLNDIRGTLSLLQLQNVEPPKDAKNAGLKYKKYLEMLVLEWDGTTQRSDIDFETVLKHLRPHTSLKSLSIKGYGGGIFPDWVGDPSFCNIASLHLQKCKYIRSLPPLGQLCSLKELSIVGLDGIVTVGREFCGNRNSSTSSSSIQSFEGLKVLRFEQMLGWEEWLSSSNAFPDLKELYIKNCPKLTGGSKLTGGLPIHIPSLAKLEIDSCPKLVASLLGSRAMMKNASIRLEQQPSGMRKLYVCKVNEVASLEGIMDSNGHLQELEIDDCSSLMSFPWDTGRLSSEKSIRISESPNLELPIDTNSCSIETLWLWDSCDSLRSFPLELFPKLRDLTFYDCRNLECLTVPEHDDRDLEISNIHIRYCDKFASFPKGGLRASNLTSLDVNRCKSLTSLPDKMHLLLPSLLTLRIAYCPQMESFPEGGLPSNLNSLAICRCEKLTANRMGWGLQNLISLTTFEISGESQGVISFPEVGLLPTSLIDLRMCHFRDLKSLDKNGLQHLTFLRNLYMDECKELEQMPEKGLPASLSSLEVRGCPLLKKQWKRKRGKEWLKIAHVPNIKIDWESIQNLNLWPQSHVLAIFTLPSNPPLILLLLPNSTTSSGVSKISWDGSDALDLDPSNGSRAKCWFKFGKNGVDAEGAGIYGRQSREDYDRDDVEQNFNYMGMLAVEGSYDKMNALLSQNIHPVDILLLMAATEGDKPKIEELLRAGVSYTVKDADGRTALDRAASDEVKDLILSFSVQNA
ncbi:putative disease resistance RPP13-like protein 1 [Morella rubra]|uniref:Protein LHCP TRANSLOCATION DEFECT n=1 Tax=Morella rubra TaxID=262757 RepID=A0A6A1UYC8_9ROSI|nr:putative disease resistance RPP13-like protein 1 [Morella rubra]